MDWLLLWFWSVWWKCGWDWIVVRSFCSCGYWGLWVLWWVCVCENWDCWLGWMWYRLVGNCFCGMSWVGVGCNCGLCCWFVFVMVLSWWILLVVVWDGCLWCCWWDWWLVGWLWFSWVLFCCGCVLEFGVVLLVLFCCVVWVSWFVVIVCVVWDCWVLFCRIWLDVDCCWFCLIIWDCRCCRVRGCFLVLVGFGRWCW